MFFDKEFDKLWYSDHLPERIREGRFEIQDNEKQVLEEHIHGFYEYIREQRCVPLLDYAYFLEFLEVLLEAEDDKLRELVNEAWRLNSNMRNGLEINRPFKRYILSAEKTEELDLREDEKAFEKAVNKTGNPDLLTMTVKEIGLSAVVVSSLTFAKIETVRELWIISRRYPKAFDWIHGIGETRQKEINDCLSGLGV